MLRFGSEPVSAAGRQWRRGVYSRRKRVRQKGSRKESSIVWRGWKQWSPRSALSGGSSGRGRVDKRRCLLTHAVTLWIPDQGTVDRSSDPPGVQSVAAVARPRANSAPIEFVSGSAAVGSRSRAGLVSGGGPAPWPLPMWRGLLCDYRLLAADGIVLNLPDTLANERAFECPSGGS